MADPQALLSHIILQTKQNVSFLVSQHLISDADAKTILSKIPTAPDASVNALTEQTRQLGLAPISPAPTGESQAPSVQSVPSVAQSDASSRRPPPPPRQVQVQVQRARAIWGYNESGADPGDLSFHPGDIIDIVEETNADWWTGRTNGRQGLFPSNYVEKLEGRSRAPPPPAPAPLSPGIPPPQYGSNKGLPPPGYGNYYPPPGPQQAPYNPYMSPPPQQQPVQVVQAAPAPAPQQQQQGGRFHGLGGTMANAAAGGFGFGAGAAIGGDLVNAIF